MARTGLTQPGLRPTGPGTHRGPTDFGLDSLLSTEFMVRAGEHFDVRLAATELMGGDRTLTHFAQLVHSRLDLTQYRSGDGAV
ncbi:acyl carrier protein [Streptomyces azureus]